MPNQQQMQAQQQAEQALQQYGQAHGLMGFPWAAVLPILIQLGQEIVQALGQGNVSASAHQQQGQPKTP